jgi:hypothetical protein
METIQSTKPAGLESLNLEACSRQIKFSERIFAARGKIRDSLRRLLQRRQRTAHSVQEVGVGVERA